MFTEITGGGATWYQLVHGTESNKQGLSTFVCSLSSRILNPQIKDHIRLGGHFRNQHGAQGIYCVIDGFNDNPKELGQIPEARAFCSRLCRSGFISILTLTAACPQLFDNSDRLPIAKNGCVFGALEVYLVAEGLLKDHKGMKFNRRVLFKFRDTLRKANSIAKQTIAD